MTTKITKDTFLPISFMFVIVIATLWIGDVNSKADTALKASVRCEQNYSALQENILSFMINIEKRLSSIEGFLKK